MPVDLMSDEPTPISPDPTPDLQDAQQAHAPAEFATTHAAEQGHDAPPEISGSATTAEVIDHGVAHATPEEKEGLTQEAPVAIDRDVTHATTEELTEDAPAAIDYDVAQAPTVELTEEVPAPTEPAPEPVVETTPAPVELAHASEPVSELAVTHASEPVAAAVATQETPPVAATTPAPPAESNKKWYVVKVQSNREDTIKAAIERKVKIEGLEEFYGQIAIPAEEYVEKKKVKVKVKDKKTGNVESVYQEKNVIKYRKKFPGYLFAEVEFNDRILYLFRETSGVGDFVGGAGPLKPPPPMTDREVQQMLTGIPERGTPGKKVAVKLDYEKGDKVRIKDGAFSGSEAEVLAIEMPKDPTDTPKVKVQVTMWGRQVPIDLDYWQVDKV